MLPHGLESGFRRFRDERYPLPLLPTTISRENARVGDFTVGKLPRYSSKSVQLSAISIFQSITLLLHQMANNYR